MNAEAGKERPQVAEYVKVAYQAIKNEIGMLQRYERLLK